MNVILIPYRNREEHLKYFIENSIPIIKKFLPDSKFVVVEQNEGKLFNRGKLLNVGFHKYKNEADYFFTHDVDLNPDINCVKNLYTKNDNIVSIKSGHNKSLGGILKIKNNIIFELNGFPNNIWGWGIEDRALFFRSYIKKIKITNCNKITNNFKIMHHKTNVEVYTGKKKKISDLWKYEYINTLSNEEKDDLIYFSGLNNLDYTIIEKKTINETLEIIKVNI